MTDSEQISSPKKKGFFKRLLFSYRALPDKKRYIEFVTAILTVPVLVTVLLTNYSNINKSKADNSKENTPQIVVTLPPGEVESSKSTDPSPTAKSCEKGIGPIEISYPSENSTITENPIDIMVDHEQGDFCAVLWSYRVNNSRWSEFDDSTISLFNLSQGSVVLELRVKSILGGGEKTLKRTFIYEPDSSSEATPSATAE